MCHGWTSGWVFDLLWYVVRGSVCGWLLTVNSLCSVNSGLHSGNRGIRSGKGWHVGAGKGLGVVLGRLCDCDVAADRLRAWFASRG